MACERVKMPDGNFAIVCGTKYAGTKERCACGKVATRLCDWKVPTKKSGTCERHGKTNFGTGYRPRSATEPYLIGTLGNPKTAKNIRNIIDAAEIDSENIGHSRKPPDQYEMLEHLCTASTRRVELFSRKSADGWDAWGNECGKFDRGK